MEQLKAHLRDHKTNDPILISNNILEIERKLLSLRFELAYFQGKSKVTEGRIERYERKVSELQQQIKEIANESINSK